MSGLVNALVIVAVVVLVVARQFRTRRVSTDRRWWIVPAVLAVVALREPGLIDAHHRTEAILLIGAEVVIGLAVGAAWAWTTRMWAEPDGTVWSRSTKAGAAVWGVGIALRLGLFGGRCAAGRAAGQLRPAARARGHPAGPLRAPALAVAVPAPGGRAGRGVR